jgi:hypothetical protein
MSGPKRESEEMTTKPKKTPDTIEPETKVATVRRLVDVPLELVPEFAKVQLGQQQLANRLEFLAERALRLAGETKPNLVVVGFTEDRAKMVIEEVEK